MIIILSCAFVFNVSQAMRHLPLFDSLPDGDSALFLTAHPPSSPASGEKGRSSKVRPRPSHDCGDHIDIYVRHFSTFGMSRFKGQSDGVILFTDAEDQHFVRPVRFEEEGGLQLWLNLHALCESGQHDSPFLEKGIPSFSTSAFGEFTTSIDPSSSLFREKIFPKARSLGSSQPPVLGSAPLLITCIPFVLTEEAIASAEETACCILRNLKGMDFSRIEFRSSPRARTQQSAALVMEALREKTMTPMSTLQIDPRLDDICTGHEGYPMEDVMPLLSELARLFVENHRPPLDAEETLGGPPKIRVLFTHKAVVRAVTGPFGGGSFVHPGSCSIIVRSMPVFNSVFPDQPPEGRRNWSQRPTEEVELPPLPQEVWLPLRVPVRPQREEPEETNSRKHFPKTTSSSPPLRRTRSAG
jgi:broad specificity phosphatase PhoE